MFCVRCGANNPHNEKYCHGCGSVLLREQGPPAAGGVSTHPASSARSSASAEPATFFSVAPVAPALNQPGSHPATVPPGVSASHPTPAVVTAVPQSTSDPKKQNGLWPNVETTASAISATKQGAGVCFFIAGLTTLVALIAIVVGHPIIGVNAWSLVDAFLFAIAGWRTLRLSRGWSIAALVLYLVECGVKLSQGFAGAAAVMMVFLTIGLINGVRGTLAYHRLSAAPKPRPSTA